MSSSGICVITAGGPYPWIIINALGEKFGPIDVLIGGAGIAAGLPEAPRPQDRLVHHRRAVRDHGAGAAGQEAACREDRRHRRGKRAEPEPKPQHKVIEIGSVNSQACLEAIRRLDPKVVLLAGCRIMKPEILRSITCPVLNYHAGITPQYRGMNGGYWALATGDAAQLRRDRASGRYRRRHRRHSLPGARQAGRRATTS